MSYEILFSAEATQSIEDQLLWYEADESRGGAELADRWLNLLEVAIETLSPDPERHKPAAENGRWNPEILIRQLLFKPWKTASRLRVLYNVHSTKKQLTILQVRHEKRPPLSP